MYPVWILAQPSLLGLGARQNLLNYLFIALCLLPISSLKPITYSRPDVSIKKEICHWNLPSGSWQNVQWDDAARQQIQFQSVGWYKDMMLNKKDVFWDVLIFVLLLVKLTLESHSNDCNSLKPHLLGIFVEPWVTWRHVMWKITLVVIKPQKLNRLCSSAQLHEIF